MKRLILMLAITFTLLTFAIADEADFEDAQIAEIVAILESQDGETAEDEVHADIDVVEFEEDGYWDVLAQNEGVEYEIQDDADIVDAKLNAAIFKIGEAWDEATAGTAEMTNGDTDFADGVTAALAFDWDDAVVFFEDAFDHYVAAQIQFDDSEASAGIAATLVGEAQVIIEANEEPEGTEETC